MDINFLENPQYYRDKFTEKFLMSWDEFQVVLREFIINMEKNNKTIFDINMFNDSHMWDKMHLDYPRVSFAEALDCLRGIKSNVFFMGEDEKAHRNSFLKYNGNEYKNFVANADANELAELIENEWFESYRLAEQNMYNPEEILPADLYVFDSTMSWFIVFTHETTDWESEIEEPMKAAASRYCIISNI